VKRKGSKGSSRLAKMTNIQERRQTSFEKRIRILSGNRLAQKGNHKTRRATTNRGRPLLRAQRTRTRRTERGQKTSDHEGTKATPKDTKEDRQQPTNVLYQKTGAQPRSERLRREASSRGGEIKRDTV